MIDCDKCVYRINGKCGYKKEGCNYIPVDEPVIPMSVIEWIKAEIAEINTEGHPNGIYVRYKAIDIINHHIKEYTE